MNTKYKDDFLQLSSSLDAIIGGNGRITQQALLIDSAKDIEAVLIFNKIINNILTSENVSRQKQQVALAAKESLYRYYGYMSIYEGSNKYSKQNIINEDNRSLEELLRELNELVGLQKVKDKVNDLIVYQSVRKLRKEQGLNSAKNTMHMAFTGNPGTGKTTVARIVGHIYKKIGILSKGHFLEVSRTDLIAGYQGQTALKVKDVIERAKGGVLFIDEAYSITENDHSDSYGRECLTELTKALEDYREDLVVIVAGYTKPMNQFFESNPGLKSRFNTFIEFEDYNEGELYDILEYVCKQNDYYLSDAAKDKIKKHIRDLVKEKDDRFANGRLIRNIFDNLTMNQAKRIITMEKPCHDQLMEISDEDIQFI